MRERALRAGLRSIAALAQRLADAHDLQREARQAGEEMNPTTDGAAIDFLEQCVAEGRRIDVATFLDLTRA